MFESRDYEAAETRKSAMWGLVALGILAVLIVVVMFAFTSGGGHHGNAGQPVPPTDLSTLPLSTPSTPPSTHSSSRTTTQPSSSSPVPTSTANPCPNATPCAVAGDAGQLVAALNKFRTSHGQPPVAGTVSPQAQQCALAQGDGPNCAPSYSWEPVPTRDGPKAISLMAGRGDGVQWLLDPHMTSFSVGWAYAAGQYEVAILKIS